MNQETPSNQLNTLGATAVDPAQEIEVAKKAHSRMSTVATPIQNVASAVGGTDNPIALVDWISSFLETLEKFNAVVDKIATVSTSLCPASPLILIRYQDSSLRTSSMDYPFFCSQGLVIALR